MPPAPPPPELQLLFAASRLTMSPDDRRCAHDALARGAAWGRAMDLAEYHGCLPLLHTHVASGAIPTDGMAPAARARLSARADEIARRNLRLSAELTAIVQDLEGHGIEVLPLKGPVLAQTVYGSVALRRIRDLDILCSPEHVVPALERLTALGYERESAPVHPRLHELHTTHHIGLRSATRATKLELHFRLLPSWVRPITLPALRDRLRRVHFCGIEVSTFRAEDLLVYLSFHGIGHAWERLEWLSAVAELLRSGDVRDWPRVNAWAAELRAPRAIAVALRLAEQILSVAPDPAAPSADRPVRSACRGIQRRLARDPMARTSSVDKLALTLRIDSSPTARFARVWEACTAVKPTDFAALPLPERLWPAYLVLRPIRLSARYLGSGVGRIVAAAHGNQRRGPPGPG